MGYLKLKHCKLLFRQNLGLIHLMGVINITHTSIPRFPTIILTCIQAPFPGVRLINEDWQRFNPEGALRLPDGCIIIPFTLIINQTLYNKDLLLP